MNKGRLAPLMAAACLFYSVDVVHAETQQSLQVDTGEAVGLLCGKLIEGSARAPELTPLLISRYEAALSDVLEGRQSVQSRAAVGLGIACGQVIAAYARQPDLDRWIMSLYTQWCLTTIQELPRTARPADIAMGKAHVWTQFLEALARVPELAQGLESTRDACLLHIDELSR